MKTITTILLSALVLSASADQIAEEALREFSSGDTSTFKSTGHRYSGPTEFTIQYPDSWAATPNARKGVLARIASAEGTGMDALVVVVNRGSNEDPDDFFTQEFFDNFNLAEATVIESKRERIGEFDGAKIEYVLEQSKPPMVIRAHCTNYIFLNRGALVQLQFYILLGDDEETNEERIKAFKPLWPEFVRTLKIG